MKVSPGKKVAFCAALEEAGGNITRAAKAIGVDRATAYRWRERDADFAANWDRSKAIGSDVLEDEATRRAFEGSERPVFHQGVQCGTIREYSDSLLKFLLMGAKPEKYRVRREVQSTAGATLGELADLVQQIEQSTKLHGA